MSARRSPLAAALSRNHEKQPASNPVVLRSYIDAGEAQEALKHLGWQAYEWWIRFGNETSNELYANPIALDLTAPIFETALRLKYMGDAVAASLFSNLWAAFGLPSADAVLQLREQVTALRADRRLSSTSSRDGSNEFANEDAPRLMPKNGLSNHAVGNRLANAARAAK